MKHFLFDGYHRRGYFLFGLIAAILYAIPVWVFLGKRNFELSWVVWLGTILFMFAILLYTIVISKHKPEYKSTWFMIVASMITVLAGILIATILTFILCSFFIPAFLTGHSPSSFLQHSPQGLNDKNIGTISTVFFPAIFGNFGVGGFVAVMGPYIFKKNQTEDETRTIE